MTKKDVLTWRDNLLADLSAKTVNDIYLLIVRSLFAWALENERLKEHVAATVRQPTTNTDAIPRMQFLRAGCRREKVRSVRARAKGGSRSSPASLAIS